MSTLQIVAPSEIIEQVKAFLTTLKQDQIEITESNDDFYKIQKDLQTQINDIDSGKVQFYSMTEAEAKWGATLDKNEGKA